MCEFDQTTVNLDMLLEGSAMVLNSLLADGLLSTEAGEYRLSINPLQVHKGGTATAATNGQSLRIRMKVAAEGGRFRPKELPAAGQEYVWFLGPDLGPNAEPDTYVVQGWCLSASLGAAELAAALERARQRAFRDVQLQRPPTKVPGAWRFSESPADLFLEPVPVTVSE